MPGGCHAQSGMSAALPAQVTTGQAGVLVKQRGEADEGVTFLLRRGGPPE